MIKASANSLIIYSTLALIKISSFYSHISIHMCFREFFINPSCPRTICDRDTIGIPSFNAYELARTMNENFGHAALLRDRNRRFNQEPREHRWFPVYWRACRRYCRRYESFALFPRGKARWERDVPDNRIWRSPQIPPFLMKTALRCQPIIWLFCYYTNFAIELDNHRLEYNHPFRI